VWSLQFSIAVFVVACPCGIGLAAPTALLVGSGLAAKFGILARGGGEAFQEMAQVDVVVFDKTGTLTEGGEPRVTDAQIIPLGEKWNYQLVLGIATELESASSHPLAIAIRNCCAKHHALPTAGTAFEEVPGRGLVARFPSHQCTAIIGNEAWMSEHHVQIRLKDSALLDTWKNQAKSVVLLAIRDESESGTQRETPFRLAALFAVMDQLRSEARAVVSRLRHNGFDTWMISGDNPKTAMAVARVVGIPSMNVIAGVLPHQKVWCVRRQSSSTAY
jgi:P-type Cu+ transporter